ncbi:MAG: hypothetical protein OXH04_12785 [Acidobacteria bacterium]|nr:hypothetical protein [Acidobacteriota bacterium]
MTEPKLKPGRAIASAALLLACLLLPASVVSHGHDDEHLDDHDRRCVLCCLLDESVLAPSALPALAAPVPLTPVAASNRAGHGVRIPLDSGLTRGPPV